MEPLNKGNKIIGIGMSILVLGTVIGITVASEKKTNSTVVENQIQGQSGIQSDEVKPVNNSNSIISSIPRSHDDSEDDDGNDDEGDNSSTPIIPTKTPTVSVPVADTSKKSTAVYKNGTYTALGSYMSPGGMDKIGVTLTLSNDIVTSVSLNLQPGDHTSQRYQNIFAANYQSYVVGKDIVTLHLTKVSSSSLTPIGFNDALAKIKSQAKA